MADRVDQRQTGITQSRYGTAQPGVLCIVHVVPGLGIGGAEMNLLRLVQATQLVQSDQPVRPAEPTQFATATLGHQDTANRCLQHHVVTLGAQDALAESLQAAGAMLWPVDLHRNPLTGLITLCRTLRRLNPDVVHGWLYKGNFLASTIAALAQPRRWLGVNRLPVIWSIRHSLEAWHAEKMQLRWLVRALGRLPFRPKAVLYNAEASQRSHSSLGFSRYPSQVIGNLVVAERGQVNDHACTTIPCTTHPTNTQCAARAQLQLPDDVLLVGLLARDHPIKNIPGFLQAAQQLKEAMPHVHFVLAGPGLDRNNTALTSQVETLGLQAHFSLLGVLSQPGLLYRALDLLVSTSFSEGTSNVLLEATNFGCVCVATRVGAASELLADEQLVVPAKDRSPAQVHALGQRLASSIGPLLEQPGKRLCLVEQAQAKLGERHNDPQVVADYLNIYQRVALQSASGSDLAGVG